jgi:hypothetical protein
MFSRDYCRDFDDSARIADDKQGHKLVAGEGFHHPSMVLFRNSNVVNFAQIGEAPVGDTSRSLPLILYRNDHSPDGVGPVVKHRAKIARVKPRFQGSEIEPGQLIGTQRATMLVYFEE